MITIKPIIVYYSKTGTTAKIAELTKIIVLAEIRKLEEPRSFLKKIGQGFTEKSGSKDLNFSVKDFDPVIVLTPIWKGDPAPIIEQFLHKVDLGGKRVVFGLVGANQTNLKALGKLRNLAIDKGCIFIDDIFLKGVKPGQKWSDLVEEDYVREANKLAEKVNAVQEFHR